MIKLCFAVPNKLKNICQFILVILVLLPVFYKGFPGRCQVKPSQRHPVTLVTSFFVFNNNIKHKFEEYNRWIPNFLSQICCVPIVIYCQSNFTSFLRNITAKNSPDAVVKFVELEDVWSLRWLQRAVPRIENETKSGVYTQYQSWKEAYTKDQYPKDRSIWRWNSPQLYAVWNAKPSLVAEVASINPYQSDYFFWIDIGSFRNNKHRFRQWPSELVLREVFTKEDKLMAGLISPLNIPPFSNSTPELTIETEIVQAGFFGGSKSAVTWFSHEFTRLHDFHFSRGHFIGIEQIVMNSVVLTNPSRFILLLAYNIAKECGDKWFYFHQYLARPEERTPGCNQNQLQSLH